MSHIEINYNPHAGSMSEKGKRMLALACRPYVLMNTIDEDGRIIPVYTNVPQSCMLFRDGQFLTVVGSVDEVIS
ncbi:MAG: hypothetical protein KKF56_03015 [Nanoarchaeota archaeon]|nr:hypothetical protein [Nanoarchaeota archaeon]